MYTFLVSIYVAYVDTIITAIKCSFIVAYNSAYHLPHELTFIHTVVYAVQHAYCNTHHDPYDSAYVDTIITAILYPLCHS